MLAFDAWHAPVDDIFCSQFRGTLPGSSPPSSRKTPLSLETTVSQIQDMNVAGDLPVMSTLYQ